MPTLTAQVREVLQVGIHTVGAVVDGKVQSVADLPLPHRVIIESEGGPESPCMFYRYTKDGQFCGDTWHEDLEAALEQAGYEYGLSLADFSETDE